MACWGPDGIFASVTQGAGRAGPSALCEGVPISYPTPNPNPKTWSSGEMRTISHTDEDSFGGKLSKCKGILPYRKAP